MRELREVRRRRTHGRDTRGDVEDLDRAPAGLLVDLGLLGNLVLLLRLHLTRQDPLLVRCDLVVCPCEAGSEGAPAVARRPGHRCAFMCARVSKAAMKVEWLNGVKELVRLQQLNGVWELMA